MKLASIKLSTVNSTKADPYLLGITLIDNGGIKETITYSFNIGDADVVDFMPFSSVTALREGLSFSDQWTEIRETFNSCDYLCCFRSGDDFNALYQTLNKRNLPFPNVSLFDVQGIARRLFMDLSDYMYKSVAMMLGVDIGSDLLLECDSKTVAELVLSIMRRSDITSLETAFDKFQISPGLMDSNGYKKLFMTRRREFLGVKDPKAEEIKPEEGITPDHLNFFYQKNVLFTGSFKEWGFDKKEECMQIITNIGGFPQKGLNGHTNVLVEGVQTATKKVDGEFSESGKQKKAKSMKAKGQDIEIISADVFFDEAYEYIIMKRKK